MKTQKRSLTEDPHLLVLCLVELPNIGKKEQAIN